MNAMNKAQNLSTHLQEHTRARALLGTVVEISATGTVERVHQAINQAFDVVAEIQALMSYQDPASELSRINQFAFDGPVAVHEHTWQVLSAAHEIAEASAGLFDITIAPRLTRLGFLPRHAHFPRASRHGNWHHIALLPGRRVQFMRHVCIDLSGIAKGYAVDRAIRTLQVAGMQAGRVNAGGDLRVFGAPPQAIHVRAPYKPTQMISLLQIAAGAAATSAIYFSQRRRGQQMVSPLIHPHTGDPCNRNRSVTVLAPNCLHADALTKVVQADPAQATQLLARYQARAFIVEQDSGSSACRIFDSGHPAQLNHVSAV